MVVRATIISFGLASGPLEDVLLEQRWWTDRRPGHFRGGRSPNLPDDAQVRRPGPMGGWGPRRGRRGWPIVRAASTVQVGTPGGRVRLRLARHVIGRGGQEAAARVREAEPA